MQTVCIIYIIYRDNLNVFKIMLLNEGFTVKFSPIVSDLMDAHKLSLMTSYVKTSKSLYDIAHIIWTLSGNAICKLRVTITVGGFRYR